ncbi:MAG: HAMP domain-containing sensor histidine kinase, partial [Arcobacteraceae bacterium]
HSQKEQLETTLTQEMKSHYKDVFESIKELHQKSNYNEIIEYPRFNDFDSAIFDADKKTIFTTKQIPFNLNFHEKISYHDGKAYFIYESEPYYLGAKYIVVFKKVKNIFQDIGKKVFLSTLFIIVLVVLTSVFLVKLILKPLRDNVSLLDRFIKDTTHELNTPVSTILNNIELIEKNNIEPTLRNKINRIKTASLTLSNIYDDLVFLLLDSKQKTENQDIVVNDLIKQRVDYFKLLFLSKSLSVVINESDRSILRIEDKKLVRVVDNLLSNGFKYSKKGAKITININQNSFSICDEGIGMSQEQVDKAFERYQRFDDTNGGFGIGLNIVYSIAKEYNIAIKIDSKVGCGTCVTLEY